MILAGLTWMEMRSPLGSLFDSNLYNLAMPRNCQCQLWVTRERWGMEGSWSLISSEFVFVIAMQCRLISNQIINRFDDANMGDLWVLIGYWNTELHFTSVEINVKEKSFDRKEIQSHQNSSGVCSVVLFLFCRDFCICNDAENVPLSFDSWLISFCFEAQKWNLN